MHPIHKKILNKSSELFNSSIYLDLNELDNLINVIVDESNNSEIKHLLIYYLKKDIAKQLRLDKKKQTNDTKSNS